MKVKIKNKGKSKTYNVVESWEEVTLEKFMELAVGKKESKTKEALETIRILSDLPERIINQLALRDVCNLFEKLSELAIQEVLTKIIEIDGVEYGMHPNLSEITLGEYADLETFMGEDVQKNLPEIMAVLFRPVTAKEGDVYTIEAYDGEITMRAEKMRKMKADQVQSALVFFWTFARIFIAILPLSLIQGMKEKATAHQQDLLQKSGDGSE
jgi:hypothetical protein